MRLINNNDKELKRYLKYKLMGKNNFIIMTTLVFFVCMFFIITALVLFVNDFLGIFSCPTIQRVLLVIFYTVVLIFYGIKQSERLWDENTVRFEGIANVITEIEDTELKKLIIKSEKIRAVKRYRAITGAKFNDALRYVNLMGIYYFNQESQ